MSKKSVRSATRPQSSRRQAAADCINRSLTIPTFFAVGLVLVALAVAIGKLVIVVRWSGRGADLLCSLGDGWRRSMHYSRTGIVLMAGTLMAVVVILIYILFGPI